MTASLGSLFDEYLQKASDIVFDYSSVLSTVTGNQIYIIPIENKKLEKKVTTDKSPKKKESLKKEKKPVSLTQKEIDDIIIKSVSRTSLDIHSNTFLNNLKKKFPGISKKDVENRIDELNNEGKLKKKDE
ncbi:hypothetical protein GPJ56_009882 [Histomonas meleagridis]|uniref:uncharacterized protein n=1 Tax=Histomonas meleagridis TaxID=135588 RepID=UPI0035599C4E|nr:hypothetical protein GPJ56_009882 [Histomonas meleagridis]KAH0802812.1 hypothetical protein GO595_004319 [Histomonas meleagridis]